MSNDCNNWTSIVAMKSDSGVVWGRFDHQRPHFGTAELSVIIGATSLLVLVMLVSYWRSRRRKMEFLNNSSPQLFSELSAAHGLDRSDRRLLRRLAAAGGQKNAAALFIEPGYFETEKLPDSEKVSLEAFRQLRHELFD